ncbi:MAG: MBL fold metallo-hydrolase [Sandaracinaceae bacterium]|nr:MBL fold metallo-hydrolase [Sandaracinaceae bacterium]
MPSTNGQTANGQTANGQTANAKTANGKTTIRFWGVRGSIASPGPHTAETGGNTSCVEVRCGDTILILDAGTGIRSLGEMMLARGERDATLLLSHVHWDHIQGLPFFLPAWIPGKRLEIAGAASALRRALETQMAPPCFPVRLSDMKAEIPLREIESGSSFEVGGARILAQALEHPGGVLGYRIEHAGRAIVYATDTEHSPEPGACPDPRLVSLAKGADVLIYDAMYTPDEHAGRSGPARAGWGHSTWQAGVAVADAAGVDRLVLFHHDPQRTDEGVRAIEEAARETRPGTVAAREGLEIAWTADAGRRAA